MHPILYSFMAFPTSGHTSLEQSPTLTISLSSWKQLSDTDSCHLLLVKIPLMIRTGISWHYRSIWRVWESRILLVKLRLSSYFASTKIAAPLSELILQQVSDCTPEVKATQLRDKSNARSLRRQRERKIASEISSTISVTAERALLVAVEKGASSWLSTLHIEEHGFTKGYFMMPSV